MREDTERQIWGVGCTWASIAKTLIPKAAGMPVTLAVVVVFPTPPLDQTTDMVVGMAHTLCAQVGRR